MILSESPSATLPEVMDTGGGPGHDAVMFDSPEGSMHGSTIRHDTKAWKAQVGISFGIAAVLCGSGLADLPGRDIDRVFMVMGYLFSLSTAFALAKALRDARAELE